MLGCHTVIRLTQGLAASIQKSCWMELVILLPGDTINVLALLTTALPCSHCSYVLLELSLARMYP